MDKKFATELKAQIHLFFQQTKQVLENMTPHDAASLGYKPYELRQFVKQFSSISETDFPGA